MESERSEQMSERDIKFGLTLPNRGVIIGATQAIPEVTEDVLRAVRPRNRRGLEGSR
jgi:hypothetical protein